MILSKRVGSQVSMVFNREIAIALSAGFLFILVIWMTPSRLFDKLLFSIIVLVFIALLVYLFGASIYLFPLAIVSWISYGPNTFFLAPVLGGATIIELSVYIGLLVFVARSMMLSTNKLASIPLIWPLLGYVAAALVAYYISPDPKNWENFVLFRQATLYALAIYYLVANNIHKLKQAVNLLAALTIGGVIFGVLVSFVIQGVFNPLSRIQQTRLAGYDYLGEGWANSPVQVATFLSLILPIAITYTMYSRRFWLGAFFGTMSLLLGLMLFLSEGRGGYMAGVASSVVVLFLTSVRRRISVRRMVVICFIFLILFIVVINSGLLSSTVFYRLNLLRDLSSDTSFIGRISLWESEWKILIHNPLGVGYAYIFDKYGLTAHNEFLQVALGSGFLGLFFYIIFFVGILRRFVQGVKHYNHDVQLVSIASLGCCVAYMFNSITDNPSTNNIWGWQIIWFVLAIGIGMLHIVQTERQTSQECSDKLDDDIIFQCSTGR